MELRQLQTFRVVATLRSFSRAAIALHYAQSSISEQIQSLERELGVTVFDRLPAGIVLTEAGTRLLDYAERLLVLAEEARMAVIPGHSLHGQLVFAAPETLCAYRLPALLQAFHQQYPLVRLRYEAVPVDALTRAVVEGQIDVAFLLDVPLKRQGLCVQTLAEEPILTLAAPSYSLAHQEAITTQAVAEHLFILTEEPCSYRHLLVQEVAKQGCHFTQTPLSFQNVEAIKQCVMAGMGITVLPAMAVQPEMASSQLVTLPWPETRFDLVTQMVWHPQRQASPPLQAFLEVTQVLW